MKKPKIGDTVWLVTNNNPLSAIKSRVIGMISGGIKINVLLFNQVVNVYLGKTEHDDEVLTDDEFKYRALVDQTSEAIKEENYELANELKKKLK